MCDCQVDVFVLAFKVPEVGLADSLAMTGKNCHDLWA